MDKYIFRALRLRLKLTQKEIADKLGISESTVAAYETGRRTISANVRMKLSSLFELTPDIMEIAQKAKTIDILLG